MPELFEDYYKEIIGENGEINKIETIIDTRIVKIIFIVKFNPRIIANAKNNISWIIIIGISLIVQSECIFVHFYILK